MISNLIPGLFIGARLTPYLSYKKEEICFISNMHVCLSLGHYNDLEYPYSYFFKKSIVDKYRLLEWSIIL